MSAVNAPTQPTDPWDFPVPSPISELRRKQGGQQVQAVPDDWDADEDEEEEEPQKLWEAANNLAPMPHLIISSANTMGSSALPPPPAAFQPSLRILKRPTGTPSTPSPSSSQSDLQQKSYAEREAQYLAARERIFGSESSTTSEGSNSSRTAQSRPPSKSPVGSPPPQTAPPASTIIRSPRGPDISSQPDLPHSKSQSNNGARGFRGRRGGKGSGVSKRDSKD